MAMDVTLAAISGAAINWEELPERGPVSLAVHAAYGHRRRLPDLDATLGACKSMIDALAVGGLILDDKQIVSITISSEKLRPSQAEIRPLGWTRLTLSSPS